MAAIKENGLASVTSSDPDVLKDMLVRIVEAPTTGASKVKKISELILKIANIDGLATSLAALIPKVVSVENFAAMFDSAGNIGSSGFKYGTFASASQIGSLTTNGFYTALGTGAPFRNSVMGYVRFVITINSYQIIGSTGNGLWFREYDGIWSLPRNIGGATDNVFLSYAQAEALITAGELSPGTVYKIGDVSQYQYILLQAATGNTFFDEGQALAFYPKYRNGTHDVGDGNETYVGNFNFLRAPTSFTTGDICVLGNRLYGSIDGVKGTATNFIPDPTHWVYVDPLAYPEYYETEIHGINYDFTNDYVREEWDAYGNRFGDVVIPVPDDGFRCHMNDWGLNFYTDEDNYCQFRKNRIRRLHGLIPPIPGASAKTSIIENNNGIGVIKDVLMRYETRGGAPVVSYNISDNQFIVDTINPTYDTPAKTTPTITSLDLNVAGGYPVIHSFQGNRIYAGGSITGSFHINNQRTCFVSNNDIFGTINGGAWGSGYIRTLDGIIISGCNVRGNITIEGWNCYHKIKNTLIADGVTLTVSGTSGNSVVMSDSSIFTTKTYDGGTYVLQQSKGAIFASLYVGNGEFHYAQGGTFQTPIWDSGCGINIVKANGVTVTGSTIEDLAITIIHAGDYKIKYEASAQSPVKIDVESKAFKGATAIPLIYNKKTYTAIDEWINSSASGIVPLVAGDVITIKHASPGAGTTSLFPGQINITVEYKGQ